ncbi:MAG: pantetheine-phosphate adenylyltransferase [Caulobacterales bacterium]
MTLTAFNPGTFDPVHNGHIDVIGRTVKLVDKLVIGVAMNEGKGPMFSLEERVAMVEAETACFKNLAEIVVMPYQGLTIHTARQVGAQMIVRGLRAVGDFEVEFQLTAMNQRQDREIETVFLMADPRHMAIASRHVKDIASMGGDPSPFVSEAVKHRLMEKVGRA